MKHLVLLLLTMLLITPSFAGEFTGAGSAVSKELRRAGFTQSSLDNSGLKVVRTSGQVELDDVRYIVTNDGLIKYNNLDHVDFKVPSAARRMKDVKSFQYGPRKISQGQIKALIID
jgi:hypothetical protein